MQSSYRGLVLLEGYSRGWGVGKNVLVSQDEEEALHLMTARSSADHLMASQQSA